MRRPRLQNFCQGGGYLAGIHHQVPDEGWRYNWGRAGVGCNRLVCRRCGQRVSWLLKGDRRLYNCRCESDTTPYLEYLDEERCEGPFDTPVPRPQSVRPLLVGVTV